MLGGDGRRVEAKSVAARRDKNHFFPPVSQQVAHDGRTSARDFNIFERLKLRHNEGPGQFIAHGGNNLVINSDSHHNYDPDCGGENADCFGSHSNDDGNRFVGNRAWHNSDDGYDLIDDVKAATWPADHYLRNNIAFGNNQNLAHANQSLIDDEANSWNAGFSASTPDSRSILSAGVEGLRQADGSLPNLDF